MIQPSFRLSCLLVAVTLGLAACGGGQDGAAKADSASATASTAASGTGSDTRVRAQAVAAPAQARWSALTTLPLVPVSIANLPDGKVMLWSAEEKFSFGAATGRTYSMQFDPATNAVTERTVTETGHNMFCTGTTNLADGRLLVNGGISAAKTSLFNPTTGTWSTGATMNIPRGYQANTLLQDGNVLTLGGSWSGGVGNKHGEVWSAAGGWRRLTGVPIDSFLSPDPSRTFGGDSHFWLVPTGNGKVLHAGPGINMHWIDANGNGRITSAGTRGDDEFSVSGNAVMYDAGKILKTGGGPGYDSVNANANSYVIDTTAGVSVRKLAPMAYRRAFHNSVVLPNGQVLIVGGQTYAVGFSDNNSVLVPELWDPATETFTTLAPISAPRNYHSVALLLPDARVLSAGGGLCGAGCAANHADLQILTPHYLLKPDGSAAVRPAITSAPATVNYGQQVAVSTDSAISSFAMVRLSSTTHAVNNDQRRLPLTFQANGTGTNSYHVNIPTNPGLALPGDWMLFAFNAEGVPSVAKIIRVSMNGSASITPIDNTTSIAGTATALQPVVTLPSATTAAYSVIGLPPGLGIDSATGRISGVPTLAGRYPVTLRVTTTAAATGAVVTTSTNFIWEIESSAALVNGLKGEYFSGVDLTGTPVLARNEAANFDWGTGTPGTGLPADNFSVRWTGWLLPSLTGNHVIQTLSDDGVRVWVDNVLVIDNWTAHSATTNNSAALALTAGQRVPVRVEYFEAGGGATLSLRWQPPGSTVASAIPLANLRSSSAQANRAPVLATPTPPLTYQGQALNLSLSASDADGDALSYSASGLPSGLGINATTGLISGTPTTGGTYDVTLAAMDGRGGSAVARFNWTVLSPAPVLLPVQTAPVASGTTLQFTAETAAVGAFTYQWNFGDGSATTAASTSPTASHTYTQPGSYTVIITATAADGRSTSSTFWQTVEGGSTALAGRSSAPLAYEPRSTGGARLWVVNPDNDSVSVIDTVMRSRIAEIAVGKDPATLAVAPDGRIWVSNKGSASLSIISPSTLAVVQTLNLARASQPHGLVIGADGTAYVAQEATGVVTRLAANGTVLGNANVGANVRHLALDAAGTQLLAARFITPPLPGEGTTQVQTSVAGSPRGGEVVVVNTANMTVQRSIVLQHSDKPDTTVQGRGIPNYLGAPAIAPDGRSAWVPSKQDNVVRGTARDGNPLDFQNTVRAISSRVDLASQAEDLAARVDHDNSGVASAAAYHPRGVYLFVALEASRQIAVMDAIRQREIFRVDAGRAPQGLVVSPDGLTLYVHNFMDRTVGVHDLSRLLNFGESALPLAASVSAVASEQLSATVLRGKQLFYDARDPRLARDGYMSCASCHNDGGQDGRTWDMTHAGEGLRNTISLRGRSGAQGRLHWSANFDEVQDFEAQIRSLAQGTGLLSDAQFTTGTRSQPLGDAKAGVSPDLDALAAYVTSLQSFEPSPARAANGALTADAVLGRQVFTAQCVSCHGGADFNDSAKRVLHNIGTLATGSGQRLGGALNGLDTPTLRDVWATAPYLHNGSAATVEAAVQAHAGLALSAPDLAAVASYTRQIGSDESAPAGVFNLVVRAMSTLIDAVGSLFEVRIDNQVVAAGQLDATDWVDLNFDTSSLAAGAGIDVVFSNDDFANGQDRNLAVQSITLNGTSVLDAAADSVQLDVGLGAAATDGLDVLSASSTGGWMPWNAAMRFLAPATATPDTVTVRAATTLAGGVGAAIELRINGVRVGSRTLANTAIADIVFATPTVQVGDRLDVVFTNDVLVNGEDRNLYIESVTARGSAMLPSAADAVIDRGNGAAAWDGIDMMAADAISGWVPWNAAMRFTVAARTGEPQTIVVRASATLASGVGAAMEVWHQGVRIGSTMVANSTPQDYSFTTGPIAAGDRIDIAFTNDAFVSAQEDRNLKVTSVTARAATLLPGDATAVLDRGAGAAAFDGIDASAGGSLGGWIPWLGALRLIAR